MLASCRGESEAVFLDRLESIAHVSNGGKKAPIRVLLADTSEESKLADLEDETRAQPQTSSIERKKGRLSRTDLRVATWGRASGPPPALGDLSMGGGSKTGGEVPPLAYLCGPPAMIDHVAGVLQAPWEEGGVGLPTECVVYEKWW